MDNCCVEVKFSDGSMIAIDTIAVENEIADNMYQRHVQRASVPYFQGFYHRLGRFFVFLNGQDSSRLALQLAAQMPPQFQSVGDEVQHAQNTRVIDARQPIKFIYHRHAFRFIVGTLNKVCCIS